jgi:hypothetical protein
LEDTAFLSKKLIDLNRNIGNSRGKEIVRLQKNLETSYRILKENYKDLIAANELYVADHSIEQPENSQKLDNFLVDFQRLLFNYLAAFISFMNHTEIFVKEMGNPELEKKFDIIMKERKIVEKIDFVKDLRKYLYHYKLPFPRVETEYFPTHEGLVTITNPFFCKGEVSLRKQQLLKWDGFKGISRDFLQGYLGNVIVMVSSAKIGCVDDCQTATEEVFEWLKDKVADLFRTEIADFLDLKKKFEKSLKQYNEKMKSFSDQR